MITASNARTWIDNFKYQILILQNQKLAHHFSYDVWRAVSSVQVAILHKTSSGEQKEMEVESRKKERERKVETIRKK